MRRFKDIIEDIKAPSPQSLWLNNGELKVYGANGWTPISVEDMNDADEEDITRNADGKLQFKGRPYGDGMGYVILRKNRSFAEQVTQSNTIYEIRYDFNVGDVEIPSNCILYFKGGQLSNGTIKGNSTLIEGDYRFDSISWSGTFINTEINVSDSTMPSVDISGLLSCFPNATIILNKNVSSHVDVNATRFDIKGNGYELHLKSVTMIGGKIHLENIVFDLEESGLVAPNNGTNFLYARNNESCVINHCQFYNIGAIHALRLRNLHNPSVTDCVFKGTYEQGAEYAFGGGVTCDGVHDVVTIERNTFKNLFGIAIGFIGDDSTKNNLVNIKDNFIDTTTGGGIKLNGSIMYNTNIINNNVNNTNCTNSSSRGAEFSAINVHGFSNLNICHNIVNAPYSAGLDIDGYGTTTGLIDRGDYAFISDNDIRDCYNVSIYGIESAVFVNNRVTTSGTSSAGRNVVFNGAHDFIAKNEFVFKTENQHIFIEARFADADAKLLDNKVYAISGLWLENVAVGSYLGTLFIQGNNPKLSSGAFASYIDRAGTLVVGDKYECYTYFLDVNKLSYNPLKLWDGLNQNYIKKVEIQFLSTYYPQGSHSKISIGSYKQSYPTADDGVWSYELPQTTSRNVTTIEFNDITSVEPYTKNPSFSHFLKCDGADATATGMFRVSVYYEPGGAVRYR